MGLEVSVWGNNVDKEVEVCCLGNPWEEQRRVERTFLMTQKTTGWDLEEGILNRATFFSFLTLGRGPAQIG